MLAPDGGMRYTETNLLNFFPEPLNASTSLIFLFIAVFWTIKLWGNFKGHGFLIYCLVLLYIGGIGGTTYHALRKWPVFIMMDWLPIMLLCVSAGVYFLGKLTKWYVAISIVVTYAVVQLLLRNRLSGDLQLFININYAMMAALVLLPVLCYLIRNQWRNGKLVGFALLSFIMALTFRIAEKWAVLATGTHFLWHIFGALATMLMFYFIYLVNKTTARS